jgi:hypothetical protein
MIKVTKYHKHNTSYSLSVKLLERLTLLYKITPKELNHDNANESTSTIYHR